MRCGLARDLSPHTIDVEDQGGVVDLDDPQPGAVNVENGPTGGVTAYMENTCTPPFDGDGVELDWLRTFWDYHTNTSPGTRVSHVLLMDQMHRMHANSSFKKGNAYFKMWEQAIGDGVGQRWTDMGTWNGIDHWDNQ